MLDLDRLAVADTEGEHDARKEAVGKTEQEKLQHVSGPVLASHLQEVKQLVGRLVVRHGTAIGQSHETFTVTFYRFAAAKDLDLGDAKRKCMAVDLRRVTHLASLMTKVAKE